jgi:hypothetical protein
MSRRGREKKQKHVEKVRAKKAERSLASLDLAGIQEQALAKAAKKAVRTLKGRNALGMAPPWKRKILEALKKRNARKSNGPER